VAMVPPPFSTAPRTLADDDADSAPDGAPHAPAAVVPAPTALSSGAVFGPPPPPSVPPRDAADPKPAPQPDAAALPDPLAAVAIAMPAKPAVVRPASPYPDPLAAVAIAMPPSPAPTESVAIALPPAPAAKDDEPLPALALPPPIRMPAKTAAASGDDPAPVAAPRIPVAEGPIGTDPAHPDPAPQFVPPPLPITPTDAVELSGDLYVRQVQEDLKKLGFFSGPVDGVLNWETVDALVRFDASGTSPNSVIANPNHLDEVWIARLKTALAAKGPAASP